MTSTQGDDAERFDVLVLSLEPAFPRCVASALLIGVLKAEQTEDGKTVRNDRLVVLTETPENAHVAVPYKGHWFYIDQTDQDTKSTFSLLLELSRLELFGKPGGGPVLTLPVGTR